MSQRDQDLTGCRLLLVDDEKTILLALRDSLSDAGCEVTTAATGDQGVIILTEKKFDIVISDVRMPGLSGIDLLGHIRNHGLDCEVILMTAYATVEQAVSTMKTGAFDYVTKPFPNEKVVRMAATIWAVKRLESEVQELRARSDWDTELDFLVGRSEPWRSLLDRVRMVAPTTSTSLIVGESGTGKELVARAIHILSPRKRGAFIKVHCASLPLSLMERELFGHVKGAYTGATQDVKGRFELAAGGTLLLDEADEMPLEVQVKLLRVLQEKVIERIGSGRPIPVDVRLLVTTKRRLEDLVKSGAFREDLYYRLSVVPILLPPLRERAADVPLLLSHFLDKYGRRSIQPCAGFTREATAALSKYDYPGNVRELEHIVEAACALSGGKPMGIDLLPDNVTERFHRPGNVKVGFVAKPLTNVMDDFERSYLAHAVAEFSGTRSELAAVLGISRKSLWQKLKKHGLDQDD